MIGADIPARRSQSKGQLEGQLEGMDMRPGFLTFLPALAITVVTANPAYAGVYMRLPKVSGESDRVPSAACSAAADSRHDQWIELVSVGSVLEHSARRGGAGQVLVTVRGSKAAGTIRGLMKCGNKLQLAVRDGKHRYLLSGASIRKIVRGPEQRKRADSVETFQLNFAKVKTIYQSRR